MILPRVALFACSYDEVDGVANTMHRYECYAAERKLPLLLVHGGYENADIRTETARRVSFRRRFPKFPLDKRHDFDLLFWRYFERAKEAITEFQPNIVHITGPSDVGILGALLAHRLNIPLAASWHTNVHEYAEERANHVLRRLPVGLKERVGKHIRGLSLAALARFYTIPRILFAPNPELTDFLRQRTGKECHLMSRGVDGMLFSPARRTTRNDIFTIGYAGRITAEKNVEMFISLERELLNAGKNNFRFLFAGQGAMEARLKKEMTRADFAGVLRGEKLAEAYANMDVFVFPSRTDTFGNVVLEALASGVPAVVSDAGGPRFIIRHGQTGFVANCVGDFAECVLELMNHSVERLSMAAAARNYALGQSWGKVFDRVYDRYERLLCSSPAVHRGLPTVDSHRSSGTFIIP